MADPTAPPSRDPVEHSVLVVDDDPLVQRMLVRMLQRRPLAVVAVGDGETALRHVADNPVDLVLLDLTMPVMDGVETLLRLRRTSDVPVVLMSGRSEQDALTLQQRLGTSERFLGKPFTLDDVMRVVDETFSS